jgi:hypothetical protein
MIENPFYPSIFLQEASVTLSIGAAPFVHYGESHLENKSKSNTIDKFGNTELHRAAFDKECKYSVVYNLIRERVDATVRKKAGRRPLDVAVEADYIVLWVDRTSSQ